MSNPTIFDQSTYAELEAYTILRPTIWGPPFEAHPADNRSIASLLYWTAHLQSSYNTQSQSVILQYLAKKALVWIAAQVTLQDPMWLVKKKYRHIVRSSTYRILCLLTLDSASASKNTHFPFCLCAVKKHVAIWSSGTATCIFDNEKKDWCNKQNFYLC